MHDHKSVSRGKIPPAAVSIQSRSSVCSAQESKEPTSTNKDLVSVAVGLTLVREHQAM